jgi:hypothetical protein
MARSVADRIVETLAAAGALHRTSPLLLVPRLGFTADALAQSTPLLPHLILCTTVHSASWWFVNQLNFEFHDFFTNQAGLVTNAHKKGLVLAPGRREPCV